MSTPSVAPDRHLAACRSSPAGARDPAPAARVVARLALVACVALGAAGHAAARAGTVDRFNLRVGAFQIDSRIDARVDEVGGLRGDRIDFNRDLELQRRKGSATVELEALLGERHLLGLRGFRLRRSVDDVELATEFLFEGQRFPVGAQLDAGLEFRSVGMDYTYLLQHEAQRSLGLGLGLRHYRMAASLDALVDADGVGSAEVSAAVSESAVAPLLRLDYRRLLGERARLRLEGAAVRKPSGSLRGNALEGQAGLEYLPSSRFGIGLRYVYSDIDVDIDKRRFAGSARLRQHGPQLLLVLR